MNQQTLARELVQAGVLYNPGEQVTLRPDQVERLGAEGYFKKDKDTVKKS